MQQLLYHTSFEQNEVTHLTSIDRNKSDKSSASTRYQQHRQKRRRQQRHELLSAHRQQHHQQKKRQPKTHYHQQQQERISSAANSLRYSRKPNQSNFKQKMFRKNMQNVPGRMHKNLSQQSLQHSYTQKCG